jgi:hypothetical protein
MLIPWQIVEISDGEKRLAVAADKDAVKGGPAFDDREITPEYEEEIYSYYGLKGALAPEDRGGYGAHFGHTKGEHPGEERPVMRTGDTETAEFAGRGNCEGGLRESQSKLEDELGVPRTEAELRVGTREREDRF